jgi:hypothetical protein
LPIKKPARTAAGILSDFALNNLEARPSHLGMAVMVMMAPGDGSDCHKELTIAEPFTPVPDPDI